MKFPLHDAQVPGQLSHGAWSFFMWGICSPYPLANIMVLTYVIKWKVPI